MRWTTRIDFDPAQDLGDVAFSLTNIVLPESRSKDKPEILAKRWQLTQEQVRVLIDWIELHSNRTGATLNSLKREQLERWKQLIT
jgi:hypothetical protein